MGKQYIYPEKELDRDMLVDFDYFLSKQKHLFIGAKILLKCESGIVEEEELEKFLKLYELMKASKITEASVSVIYVKNEFYDLVISQHDYEFRDREIYFENIDRYYNIGSFAIEDSTYATRDFAGKNRGLGGY